MAFKKSEGGDKAIADKGPVLCSWNDFGETCSARGILSPATGGSPWYCREHFYRLRHWSGMEGKHGNELPAPITSSRAVDEEGKKVKPRRGNPFAKYVNIPREPGQDDEERLS